MAQIILRDLVKQFGSFTAVKGINLEVRDGEFLIMVGPSGCGKTTTLNMISGLVMPTSGEIRIGERVVTHTEPAERGLGMVFQDLALFPHMSVYDNIAFGLRVKQVDRALLAVGRCRRGDSVVIVAGSPPGLPGSTNALRVHRIGDAVAQAAPAYRV